MKNVTKLQREHELLTSCLEMLSVGVGVGGVLEWLGEGRSATVVNASIDVRNDGNSASKI